MNEFEFVANHKMEFLKYLKSKFPLYHKSNVFFRDFHFGVMGYLKEHGMRVMYPEGEKIACEFGLEFEKDGTFKKIDHQSWLLNYPEFALPRVEKKAS